MERRDFLQGLAAATAAQWEDLEDIEDLEPLGHEVYSTGEISPEEIVGHADGKYGGVAFEEEDFTNRMAEVWYWKNGVSLDIEAEGEDTVSSGQLLTLTPRQARELAVNLFQAAEELDRRREVDDGGE
jgi:hypothetical protein